MNKSSDSWWFLCPDLWQAVAQQLCENQLGEAGSPLCVRPDQDLGEQSLVCLLTHLRLALRPGAHTSHLLNPLHQLLFQPANMAVRFFTAVFFLFQLVVHSSQGSYGP